MNNCCCYSVAKLYLTLCNFMDSNMLGFPLFHYLLAFAQTHSSSQWCYVTISSSVALFSFCLQSFPESRSFPMSWIFSPSNEYSGLIYFGIDWFDLLAVQGTLSRVFSSTTNWRHQFFSSLPSLWSNSYIHVNSKLPEMLNVWKCFICVLTLDREIGFTEFLVSSWCF